MSQPNFASAMPPNIQMPVCHMASLPSLKSLESKSGPPAPSASVGMVLPDLAVSQVAAATPSGELNAAVLPSSLERATGLRQRLVELMEGHRLVVPPHALGLVRQLERCGLLFLPRPGGGGDRHLGRVEE